MKTYTVSEYKDVLQKLHSFHPAGLNACEAWNCICIYAFRHMVVPSNETQLSTVKKLLSVIKSFLQVIGLLCLRKIEFSNLEDVGQKTILYLSHFYRSRSDMCSIMQKISQISDEVQLVCTQTRHSINLNPCNLFFPFNWFRQLRAMHLSDSLTRILFFSTADAYLYAKAIRRNAERILCANAFLSLNDENADENLLVQFCKKNEIPTATLQHGHFWNTKDSQEVIHYAHNFKELTADYLLAWGQYTCDLAMRDGVTAERLIPVGIPKYVDEPQALPIRHEHVFGVFLDAASTGSKTNLDLIRYANDLSEAFGYSYMVKLHPTDSPDRYQQIVNDRFLGFAEPMTVLDFCKQIDFSIMCASTVFFEQLYFQKPCFRYLPQDSIDLFEGIDFSVFSDKQQLSELMQLYCEHEETYMQKYHKLVEYCCGAGSILENYRNAIRQLSQKKDKNR